MQYNNITAGKFISRPNRFIAEVEIGGEVHRCHVKNTGRCRELLVPGACLYLEKSDNPNRKTLYDVVAVRKGETLINMDSQAPNKVVQEWLESGGLFENVSLIKPEAKYKNSRFDFYIEADGKRAFIEVKGVTLENNGIAMFPDAPTERGIKHINELCECVDEGYSACIIFVVQMKGVHLFTPNYETHPEFGEALKIAALRGVKILCMDCDAAPGELKIGNPVEVRI